MAVNPIGQTPTNIAPTSMSSESSLLIINNNSDDDDKKDDFFLYAYHVEISQQALDFNASGTLPEGGNQNATYNSAGRMAGSAGASAATAAAGASAAGGASGAGGSGNAGGSGAAGA